jgi:hypothetical protein
MRSNARWHQISRALQNGHRFLTEDNKAHSFGYEGECEFTNLAFIDRGIPFMSDTLHTIYHGAFVRTKEFFKIGNYILFSKIEKIITVMERIFQKGTMVNNTLSSIYKC